MNGEYEEEAAAREKRPVKVAGARESYPGISAADAEPREVAAEDDAAWAALREPWFEGVPEALPTLWGEPSVGDDLSAALSADANALMELVEFPPEVERTPSNAAALGAAIVAFVEGLLLDADLPTAALWLRASAPERDDEALFMVLASPRSSLRRRAGLRRAQDSSYEVPLGVVTDAVSLRTDVEPAFAMKVVRAFFTRLQREPWTGFGANWSWGPQGDGRVELRLLSQDLGIAGATSRGAVGDSRPIVAESMTKAQMLDTLRRTRALP